MSYANEIIDKKIFVEDLYAKSHFRKQYFSVSSMRSFFLSTPITRLWPQISDGHGGSIYIRLKKQSFYDVLDDVQHCRSDLGIVFLMKSHSNRITRLCSVKDLDYHLLGESHISIVTRADHPILQAQETVPVEDRMTDYPYVIAENHENFGRFYDDDSESISQLFQSPPKCIISINDSAASQDIVAQSDAFFISSTRWQHPQHYHFSSVPLKGEDSILAHYYVTKKGRRLTFDRSYVEELKKCSMVFNEDIPTY
ncbi:MAG: hypothetical protein EP146_16505 [Oscillibacter sp.]|uniref:hypothetical protein n=1 Tax=Oscillibacter sp. TaxID=1945593 RepID=UPI00132502AD|nr:hypothetical protein [Oscillibacter sp.]